MYIEGSLLVIIFYSEEDRIVYANSVEPNEKVRV